MFPLNLKKCLSPSFYAPCGVALTSPQKATLNTVTVIILGDRLLFNNICSTRGNHQVVTTVHKKMLNHWCSSIKGEKVDHMYPLNAQAAINWRFHQQILLCPLLQIQFVSPREDEVQSAKTSGWF